MNEAQTHQGLSTQEAEQRLLQVGPNFVEEKRENRLLLFLRKFITPIPFVLEATIILELVLHKYDEAIIVGILLVFNAVLSFIQEDRANKALLLLQSHLIIQARVFRNEKWGLIDSKNLVPGDLIHLRMGDISPADVQINNGSLLIDQSSLTGESMPVEVEFGKFAYSGCIIKKGEATGEVIATGKNTYFGKTISLMQMAKTTGHIKDLVFSIMKFLFIFVAVLIIILCVYAAATKLTFMALVPYFLVILLASIPVALPATFTLATALGALQLVKQGVLITRLSALEEASSLDLLCVDKTGTLTENLLELAVLSPIPGYSENRLLHYASFASDEATQDPIDQAILRAASLRNVRDHELERSSITPFDPANKFTEARGKESGKAIRVLKGSVDIIAAMSALSPELESKIMELGNKGYRLLAIALAHEDELKYTLIGLIGFYDPPRADTQAAIAKIISHGIRMVMLTGDNVTTARTLAERVGLGSRVCSVDLLKHPPEHEVLDCDVFANLYPEEKFLLVKYFQNAGHIVGMTGDGINDAPALKQAEVGISVANAGDASKAAASIVLTRPGLKGIGSTIVISRRITQRMQTYVINKISKCIEVTVLVTLGFILTGDTILTPFFMVLRMFMNDFSTMSIATDNASYSLMPERWNIHKLIASGTIIGCFTLILLLGLFFYGINQLQLSLPELQTFVFLVLAFTAQSNIYIIRERQYFWKSLPSKWLILSSVSVTLILSFMAVGGILMAPLSPPLILSILGLVIGYSILVDLIKVHLFSWLNLP